MLDKKNLLLSHPNIFLGLCIVIAVIIYAFANRYETTVNQRLVLDKWTGKTFISKPEQR